MQQMPSNILQAGFGPCTAPGRPETNVLCPDATPAVVTETRRALESASPAHAPVYRKPETFM